MMRKRLSLQLLPRDSRNPPPVDPDGMTDMPDFVAAVEESGAAAGCCSRADDGDAVAAAFAGLAS